MIMNQNITIGYGADSSSLSEVTGDFYLESYCSFSSFYTSFFGIY